MTSTRDVQGLGQFDLNSFINLLPGGSVKQTLQDASAIAQNPITGAVKSIEFWTAFSPKKYYTGKELDAIYRDPTPNPYLKFIKPTIVIDSVLGKRTVSPYGEADPNEWQENVKHLVAGVTIIGGFTAVGLLIVGAALGRARK